MKNINTSNIIKMVQIAFMHLGIYVNMRIQAQGCNNGRKKGDGFNKDQVVLQKVLKRRKGRER